MRSVFVSLVIVASYGCGAAQERPLSRADLGADWPFTVDAGVLACEPGNHVVFRTGGKTYAINGSAKGASATNGYVDSDPIVVRRPLGETKERVDRLAEADRQRLFTALVDCEARAADEAIARCKAQVRADATLTDREGSLIAEEGINAGWPPMSPFLASVSDVIQRGLELCR